MKHKIFILIFIILFSGKISADDHNKIFFLSTDKISEIKGSYPSWANFDDIIVYTTIDKDFETSYLNIQNASGYNKKINSGYNYIYFPKFTYNDKYIIFAASNTNPKYKYSAEVDLLIYDTVSENIKKINVNNIQFNINYRNCFAVANTKNIISFTINEEKRNKLIMYNIDDESLKTAHIGESYSGFFPSWSPDDSLFGFSYGGGGYHLFNIINFTQYRKEEIQGLELTCYFLWLTNDKIIFERGGAGTYQISTYDLNKNEYYNITEPNYNKKHQLSTDKKFLIYEDSEIFDEDKYSHVYYYYNLETNEKEVIATIPSNKFYSGFDAVLNKNGDKIALYDDDMIYIQELNY